MPDATLTHLRDLAANRDPEDLVILVIPRHLLASVAAELWVSAWDPDVKDATWRMIDALTTTGA